MGSQCSNCGDQDKATENTVGGNEPATFRPAQAQASTKSPEPVVTPERIILHPTAEQTQPHHGSALPASKHASHMSGAQGQSGTGLTNHVQLQPQVQVQPQVESPRNWQPTSAPNQVDSKAKKAFEAIVKRDAPQFSGNGNAQNKKIVKNIQNGSSFQGFVNSQDEPHGWGVMVTNNGEMVEGHFQNGEPVKQLRYFTKDGCLYDGDMAVPELKLHGSGTMMRQDGNKITCNQWERGTPMGAIIETDPQGKKIFQGYKSQNGHKQKECELTFANFTLKGTYKDDQPVGVVQKIYNDGKVYVGHINKENQEEGEGTLTFVDGRKFSGPFSKGLANGVGVFTTDSGKSIPQTWKNGHRA